SKAEYSHTHERPNHHTGYARPGHLNKILLRAHRELLADRLRIVVLGEFKSGKSSLLNALLDDAGAPHYRFGCPAMGRPASGVGMTFSPVDRMSWGVVSPAPEASTDR
ncbi:hypothetical protein AB0B78_01235, partial [Streptomyces sp. NPDC040724]|uniref:hypothetical protein n=1 Tax=Streptomyces sp. NPDC040724 TaxID=3155612 RepID=UPI0033CFFD0A